VPASRQQRASQLAPAVPASRQQRAKDAPGRWSSLRASSQVKSSQVKRRTCPLGMAQSMSSRPAQLLISSAAIERRYNTDVSTAASARVQTPSSMRTLPLQRQGRRGVRGKTFEAHSDVPPSAEKSTCRTVDVWPWQQQRGMRAPLSPTEELCECGRTCHVSHPEREGGQRGSEGGEV
jgi:hypothetical protein